jgi:aminopeptidase N
VTLRPVPSRFLPPTVLALLVGLAVVAAPAGRASASPGPERLAPDEVLRLTEEAGRMGADGKQALASRPIAVQKDSTHSYDALHWRLDVKVTRTQTFVQGTVTTTLAVRDAGLTMIDFDAIGMTFTGVRVNGNPRTTWTYAGGKLDVPICEGGDCPAHGPGDQLTVAIDYSCFPATGFFHYPRNDYTLVEPDEAKYWWPCYDQPSDKATLDLYATVPDTNSCWSNGVLVDVTPATPGFSTWHWQETHPIATYLVSIAVANYWKWTQTAGAIPIVNVTWPEDSTKAKSDYANVPAMLTTYTGLWAPYPFDKYGQASVDPFGAGGMEHQTMTTLRRSLLRGDKFYEYVWAHELAHQWWGDWVTCVDFRDIWLNEGFADYAEAQWVENFYGPAKYDSAVVSHMTSALNADASFRYAIYDPPPGYTFGATIYKKGGMVLHMLRRILGDGPFYAGFALYGSRYAYGTASTRDFQHAMEDASGQALGWFFDEWIFAAGIPTYQWSWQAIPAADPPSPGQSDVTLSVQQVQTAAPFYRMPITFKVTRSALADTFVTVSNDAVAQQAFVVRVNGTPTGVVFDPRNSILKRTLPVTVDAGPPPALAGGAHLSLGAIPNPARGATTLRASWVLRDGSRAAGGPARARFRVFDAAGRLVRDLGEVTKGPGEALTVTWDRTDRSGSRVAPGLYFAEVVAGARREARPVVILE